MNFTKILINYSSFKSVHLLVCHTKMLLCLDEYHHYYGLLLKPLFVDIVMVIKIFK